VQKKAAFNSKRGLKETRNSLAVFQQLISLKFKHLAVLAFFKNLFPVIVQKGDLPALFFRGVTFYRTVNRGFTAHNFTAQAVVIVHNKLFPFI
jgi:hypothetical protein